MASECQSGGSCNRPIWRGPIAQSRATLPAIGSDLAKSVFKLHIVEVETGEIQRRRIKRAKLTECFARCEASLVARGGCGTSHFWARTIRSLGHHVKLPPVRHVKAFLLRDQIDAMDAQAIWVAVVSGLEQRHVSSSSVFPGIGMATHVPTADSAARHPAYFAGA